MKIAVFGDIHGNLTRWKEAEGIIKREKIDTGICLGDLTTLDILKEVAKPFKKMYLSPDNSGDYDILRSPSQIPENVEWCEGVCDLNIYGRKIAIVHRDRKAREVARDGNYDIVFYGHTHTPWEEKVGNTILLNPGEIAGQRGKATFAIYDLKKMSAELKLLK